MEYIKECKDMVKDMKKCKYKGRTEKVYWQLVMFYDKNHSPIKS